LTEKVEIKVGEVSPEAQHTTPKKQAFIKNNYSFLMSSIILRGEYLNILYKLKYFMGFDNRSMPKIFFKKANVNDSIRFVWDFKEELIKGAWECILFDIPTKVRKKNLTIQNSSPTREERN